MEIPGTGTLQIDVGPSRYFIARDGSANLMKWQIGLADASWRDIIFNDGNSKHQLNIRAMPVAGLEEFDLAAVDFACSQNGEVLTFEPKDSEQCSTCIPRVSYKLSDLSIHIEISLDNVGAFPIYWCPLICVPIHLPWHGGLTIDQYSIRSKAKKKFLLNNDLSVVESAKCAEKVPINLTQNSILAINGMQDYRASIITKNEEEALSVIFCGKYQNAHLALKQIKRNYYVDLLCMPDLPNYDAEFKDWLRYRCIQPNKSDSFAVELSAY
ncbi:MAG: hypothetical protein LBF25_03240 [Puniceicoccales bacterium]|jgi:hypothetical protein|nr:hypothetical protein [Puniceicoccales bacterium]